MKSSTSKIGVITSDDPPRGGLGRVLRDIVSILQETFTVAAIRKSRYGSWFLFRLQQWVDRNRIETLLFPTGPGGLFLLRKPKGVRIIVICYHTYWQQCRMVPGSFWKRIFVPLERRTLRTADRVLCYCEDTMRVLEEEYGLKNVRLMRQILDIPRAKSYKLKAKSYVCLYIGRKDRRKGYHVMMEAWGKVQKDFPHAQLRCITNGDLSDEDVRRHMHDADLVVVPSYLEGFGLVAAQAMMMGKAVLACNSDGLKSLIRPHDTGWLVPPGDAHALISAWVKLLSDDALRARLGSHAAEFMRQRFNRAKAIEEFMIECSAA